MFVIGNDELRNCTPVPADGMTICPACHEPHPIKYGERINSDGTKEPSKRPGYVKCGENYFLVALNGKIIN